MDVLNLSLGGREIHLSPHGDGVWSVPKDVRVTNACLLTRFYTIVDAITFSILSDPVLALTGDRSGFRPGRLEAVTDRLLGRCLHSPLSLELAAAKAAQVHHCHC